MSESICFILPHPADGPTGGYKVVYEYANRLAADGFLVDIVYSGSIFWKQKTLRFKLTSCIRYVQRRIKGFSSRGWFPLDKRVKEHFTLSMNYRHVPKADVYVATSPYTAWYLNEYPVAEDRKFYFIQGYENWGPGLRAILEDTYHFPLRKIVIARWLQKMLEERYGEKSVVVPNGFDFDRFSLTTPINDRAPYSLSMLYHNMESKRCADAMEAIRIVKERFPQVRVNAFGVPERPADMPEWYTYYRMPDAEVHNALNNESAIFVSASESEGWGLTVGEAMICGEAVCCTDNDGHREMAIDGETALLSPVRDPRSLADNIIRLIEDDTLRIRIAERGRDYIQKFRWDESYKRFRSLLTGEISMEK
ncbi:MAG: glycosyltransferase family 4 protein [Muribaculaceae bacterium]|nr:glycosyltransferase family 4 protein [Muribaculaceae bacterium]